MIGLYNYKIWNPNLLQFVAQPDLRTVDDIRALGGIVISDLGCPSQHQADLSAAASSAELAASH